MTLHMTSPVEKEKPDAYRKALGLLVRREHSRRELRRKLDARGVEPDDTELALDTLSRQGYQDDTRFAEMLVRTRIGGGYGPTRIRAELGMHDIAADTIDAALSDADPDWLALARDALRRRYGHHTANEQSDRIKRSQFLMRRGFDGDTIRAALQPDRDD